MFKELTVDEWIDELNSGFDFRRKHGIEDKWSELESLFYAVHESNIKAGPNLIAANGDATLSQLTVPKATFTLKALRPQLVTASRVLESVDNSLSEAIGLEDAVESSTLHAYLWGSGIIKIGYDSEFGFAQELTLGDKLGLGLTMSQFDKKGRRIEFANTHPGMPWVSSCLPHDIIIPFGVRKLSEAPWIAHRVVRHIDDIKADAKYENKGDLRPVMSAEDFVNSYNSLIKPFRVGGYDIYSKGAGNEDFCELFEIHCRRTGKIFVISTGHKKFLRSENDLLQIGGLPFVGFSLVPHTRSFWVTPDSYYLLPYQTETSDISRIASSQRRASLLRFLYGEDAFDDGELDKVFSPKPNVGIRVKGGVALREAILPMTPQNNNISLYNDADYVRRCARETVGFSRNQMGEFEQKSRITATETMAVKEGGEIRLTRRQKVIKKVYIECIRHVNDIIFEFWKTPRWTEVAGPEGAQWMEFIGKQLRGDYAYDIIFSSEEDLSKKNRAMTAIQIYSAMSQDPSVDPVKLREYLINAFGDQEFSSIFGGLENMPLQSQGLQKRPSKVNQPAGKGTL